MSDLRYAVWHSHQKVDDMTHDLFSIAKFGDPDYQFTEAAKSLEKFWMERNFWTMKQIRFIDKIVNDARNKGKI